MFGRFWYCKQVLEQKITIYRRLEIVIFCLNKNINSQKIHKKLALYT